MIAPSLVVAQNDGPSVASTPADKGWKLGMEITNEEGSTCGGVIDQSLHGKRGIRHVVHISVVIVHVRVRAVGRMRELPAPRRWEKVTLNPRLAKQVSGHRREHDQGEHRPFQAVLTASEPVRARGGALQ